MTATAQLATVDREAIAVRDGLSEMLTNVREATTWELPFDATKRIRLAREWAKIHGKILDLRRDLLRAELLCLRQLAKLSGPRPSVGPGFFKLGGRYKDYETVDFFRELTDATIEDGLVRWPTIGTGLAFMAAVRYNLAAADEAQAGHNIATGSRTYHGRGKNPSDDFFSSDNIKTAIKEQARGTAAALARIVEDYARIGKPFSVSEMADDIVNRLVTQYGSDAASVDMARDESLHRAIAEVCREAIRAAPVLEHGDMRLPRFVTFAVTTITEDHKRDSKYLRIPLENATLLQFENMIEVREERLAAFSNSIDRLRAIRDMFAAHTEDAAGELLGAVLARLKEDVHHYCNPTSFAVFPPEAQEPIKAATDPGAHFDAVEAAIENAQSTAGGA